MPNRRLQNSLKKLANKKQDVEKIIHGTLGMPIGGQKLVEVPNRAGYVYVKLRDNQSEFIQAYNSEVSTIYDLPVLVTRQNNIYKVIGRDQDRYRDWGAIPYLPKHGGQHSFNNALGMGADVTWIYSQQLMPLLGYPSGSNGSNGIVVAPHLIRDLSGNWKYVGNTGTPDITMYRPTIATGAVMVLVYIDTVSGNPYLLVGSGTTFHVSLTGTSDIARFIPTIPNPAWMPNTAIRLTTGTTTLTWTNLYDARPFLQVVPTGSSGGGSGINTGTLDSLYLRLDTSNNPLTGRLKIIPSTDNTDGLYAQSQNGGHAAQFYQIAYNSGTITSPAIELIRDISDLTPVTFSSDMIRVIENMGSGTFTGSFLTYSGKRVNQINLNPGAQGTGTLAQFDGNYTLSPNGLLLLLKNNNSPRFYVNASGTAYSNGEPLIKEAPVNGLSYVRKNAGWEIAVTGSSGGTVNPPVTGSFVLQDDGQTLGSALILNAGQRITASLSGTTALLDADTVLLQTDDFTSQINGTVTTFGPTTLLPVASTARLYYNGLRQRYNFHYTISGSYVQTLFTPVTGSVLLLDYNESSTTGTLTSIIGVQDEGILKGNVNQLNFVGSNVQAAVSGLVGTVTVNPAANDLAFGRAFVDTRDYITGSTTFVNVDTDKMSVSLTLNQAHRCLIVVSATAKNSSTAQNNSLDLSIDGTRQGGTYGFVLQQGTNNSNLSFSHETPTQLASGSHTFKLMYRADGGTMTLFASSGVTPLIMSVQELYG